MYLHLLLNIVQNRKVMEMLLLLVSKSSLDNQLLQMLIQLLSIFLLYIEFRLMLLLN